MPSSVSVISAPMARSDATWKSVGRRPILSPPTNGTNASPLRWRAGPSMRMGMRLRPVNSSGTRPPWKLVGSMVMRSPSTSTSAPRLVRILRVMPTSPMSGALMMVLGPLPSRVATMCLVTAFFEPRTRTEPDSGPAGSTTQVPPDGALNEQPSKESVQMIHRTEDMASHGRYYRV